MPGMTGIELARRIRRAGLPIILATGYAELPNAEIPGLPRLAKPYRQSELAVMLAALHPRQLRRGKAVRGMTPAAE